MDRRTFIASASTATLIAAMRPAAGFAQSAAGSAPPAPGSDAALNQLFERIFNDTLDNSPEFCTALGYDKGARKAAKSKLDGNGDRKSVV